MSSETHTCIGQIAELATGEKRRFCFTRRPTRTNCGCANTPRNRVLSTTNLLYPKNGNACWLDENNAGALAQEGQAASITKDGACETNAFEAHNHRMKHTFPARFEVEERSLRLRLRSGQAA